jgi:1,4-alpha-glucan branching enzyme
MASGFPDPRADGVLRVPATNAERVVVRFAPVLSRDTFDPADWRHEELSAHPDVSDWYELNIDDLDLDDGRYEYEFLVYRGEDDPDVAADPFAEEITRFQGHRGTFRIRDGEAFHPPFDWSGELPEGVGLPRNDELVIYELPVRWAAPAEGHKRDVPDGDFQDLLSERLDYLADLGVNAVELLPIQDAAVSLDWGYGTRFFSAPDLDFGGPIDAKFLIKECHRRGIRVFMDIVMNHSRECPLETLAPDRFYLDPDEEPGRPDWGGRRFDFEAEADGHHPAREFLVEMAAFWIREYRIDGFRLDEFKGMDHPAFVQEFHDRVREVQADAFPDRPFLVVAEDSWNRTRIVHDDEDNPDGRQVVDSMWNFDYREESRRLVRDEIDTEPKEPSRSDRIEALVSGDRTWDDLEREFEPGFGDLSKAVNYTTSHDMGEEGEQRLMNFLFGDLVAERGLGDGSIENVRYLLDDLVTDDGVRIDAHEEAVDRVRGAFAVLLTSVGIPMFLAGEEFGDVHDLDYTDWKLKMEDPVRWPRRDHPGHAELEASVSDLIHLRTSTGALQRNEVDLFHTHPTVDDPDGERVFAYCRTGDEALGSEGQVVVVANLGPNGFDAYDFPWYWGDAEAVEERGEPIRGDGGDLSVDTEEEHATLSLPPFQVRVFLT